MHERWRSGVFLLLSVLLFVGIVAVGPSDEMGSLRRVLGIGGDRLGEPADVAPGGTFAYLQHQPGRPDEPVAWDPCRPIRFEVNPEGSARGTDDTVDFVRDAVEEVASVTGLRFEYDGLTDRRPEWRSRFLPAGRREPVLIAWADDSEVEDLAGDVVGVGGAVAVEVRSSGWRRYVTGGVTLDEDAFAELEDGDEGVQQRAILLHELGHVVGLGHVDSPRELMNADNVGQTGFGRGDLNGLVRLGRGRCA